MGGTGSEEMCSLTSFVVSRITGSKMRWMSETGSAKVPSAIPRDALSARPGAGKGYVSLGGACTVKKRLICMIQLRALVFIFSKMPSTHLFLKVCHRLCEEHPIEPLRGPQLQPQVFREANIQKRGPA